MYTCPTECRCELCLRESLRINMEHAAKLDRELDTDDTQQGGAR